MKVIISGGGTGGHIYPAIAIADALKRKVPQVQVLFVGAEGKMEMEKVPKAGYEIVGLPVAGLQRKLSFQNLKLPFKIVGSLLSARKILKKFKPDVAVGVGGYASMPTLYMAGRQKIPIVVQEQNGYAGLTNKILAKYAQTICVAYPNMEAYFPKEKIRFTGNPVRGSILQGGMDRETALAKFGLSPNRKTLLLIGGSLGARTLNNCLREGWHAIVDAGFQLIWATGKIYYRQLVKELGEKPNPQVCMQEFIYEMEAAYQAADLVVSRAGALSLSELSLAQKAALLVPSPNVAEDHQTKNAQALVKEGAAVMVSDAAAPGGLVQKAIGLLQDEKALQSLSENISRLAKPNAADEIAEEVIRLNR